jgi:hypothetical protein
MNNITNGGISEQLREGTGHTQQFSVILSILVSSLIHHWFTTRFAYQTVYGLVFLRVFEGFWGVSRVQSGCL